MKASNVTNIRKWIGAIIFGGALCAAALTSIISNPAFANETLSDDIEKIEPQKQSKPSKSGRPTKHQSRKHPRLRGPMVLIEQLDINPKQRAKAKQIITEQHQKRMTIHQQSRQSRELTHQKMREVHQQTIEKLGAVLSPAQLKEFEQLLEQHKPARPPHHRNGNKRGGQKDSFNRQHQD